MESVLFYLDMGSRDRTQVVRIAWMNQIVWNTEVSEAGLQLL